MNEATLQITAEELKKMLTESFLPDDLKTAYLGVFDQMTDDEKTQLQKILEDGNKAKTEYEKQRLEQLARLNAALVKHLQDVAHKEQQYALGEFEKLGNQEDEQEMLNIEQQIKNL